MIAGILLLLALLSIPVVPALLAIAIGECLLLAQAGETFTLSATPIWVRKIAIALAIDNRTLETDDDRRR